MCSQDSIREVIICYISKDGQGHDKPSHRIGSPKQGLLFCDPRTVIICVHVVEKNRCTATLARMVVVYRMHTHVRNPSLGGFGLRSRHVIK